MPSKLARNEDNSPPEDTVQLDLEGFNPKETDQQGIAELLKHIFPDGSTVNVKELATYIILHNTVGTVVKPAAEEEDAISDMVAPEIVFGVTSVVNLSLSECEKYSVVKSLRDWILSMVNGANDDVKKNEVAKLFENDPDCRNFLLLNERFENLPLSICAEAVVELPTELKEAKLSPTHFLMICRAFQSGESIEYAYPEVEYIRPFSLFDLEVPVESADTNADDFNTNIILIIKAERFHEVLDALKSHV